MSSPRGADRLAAIDPSGSSIDERAHRIVGTLWEFYGGPRFCAAAEILMGTRPQAALQKRVRAARLPLAAAYRDMWDRLMRDTLPDPDERYHLLQFVIATLRGLALVHFHVRDAALYDPHLARLREMIAAAMRDGAIKWPVDSRGRSVAIDLDDASAIFV